MTTRSTPVLAISDYWPADAEVTLKLFQRAVHEIACRDYTPAQINAWTGGIDQTAWAEARLGRPTWIALHDHQPAGFADLMPEGHLDMLFVNPDFQRHGIASALLAYVEHTARQQGLRHLTIDSSLTALPFFKGKGFEIVREQKVERQGQILENYRMEKRL